MRRVDSESGYLGYMRDFSQACRALRPHRSFVYRSGDVYENVLEVIDGATPQRLRFRFGIPGFSGTPRLYEGELLSTQIERIDADYKELSDDANDRIPASVTVYLSSSVQVKADPQSGAFGELNIIRYHFKRNDDAASFVKAVQFGLAGN